MEYAAGTGTDAAFPLSAGYRAWLTSPGDRVTEDAGRAFLYRERHLQCVWFDARWRPRLATHAGEPVTVEFSGRWNLESGPDFRDAVLRVGPDERRIVGDVEVHVAPVDWRHHGHAADPLYANVVAHVTYREGTIPADELPAGALQIALHDALAARPTFAFEAIDLAAYPYGAPAALAPCARILADWTPGQRRTVLAMAGQERLRLKAARAQQQIEARGPAQALFDALLAALGYKHNRIAGRALAACVPIEELQAAAEGDATTAYAILVGAAGLLPDELHSDWTDEARGFVRDLWDRWWRHRGAWQHRTMSADDWHLAHLRPTNHPLRRLAAAAAMALDMQARVEWLNRAPETDARTWYAAARRQVTPRNPIAFWDHYLAVNGARRDRPTALVGAGRAAAMVTNVLVPFRAALGHDVAPLAVDLPHESDNQLMREAANTLFGRDHNPTLYRDGLAQQGLMQIHRDFCLSRRRGCVACPLPRALANAAPRPA